MSEADVLVCKVNEWVDLQKKCSRKLKNLADEMEEAVKTTKERAAGVLTSLTREAGLPVVAAVGAARAVASGTSVGSDMYTSKSKDIMEEAQKVLEEQQSLEEEMKNLIESLKQQTSSFHGGSAAGGGGDDDDDPDGNVMEFFMTSMARQEGLDVTGIIITAAVGLPPINMFKRLKANDLVIAACLKILTAVREGQKKAVSSLKTIMASSLGKKAAGKAAGNIAGGAVDPELVSDFQNLDIETEASQTLRENARTVRSSAEETEKELQEIRGALKNLVRIKFIIQKESMSKDEKRELINRIINNIHYQEVQQWLEENAESDILVRLVYLAKFIAEKLNEEAKKKKKEDRKKRKIELIFLAHGSIDNRMIPARFMMPLPSIKDVLLYSPWNCLLRVKVGYSIAKGSIQPDHRLFECWKKDKCHCSPETSHDVHKPLHLPSTWNSMKNAGLNNVPVITVSPVGHEGDRAFPTFTALTAQFGAPAANRYLVPYLTSWFGIVPFCTVTLAISQVLPLYGYEATVHLAACLGKSRENDKMEEEYLREQYAYTVNNTRMTVSGDTFSDGDETLYNMFRAVFGD